MVDPTTVTTKVFSVNGGDHPIRFYGTNESPLFRATDVGRALGLTNIHESIKSMQINQDHFTCDGATFLTEIGLDRMLLKSRRAIAETMHAWVKETLREIRLAAKGAFERDLDTARRQVDESQGKAKREGECLQVTCWTQTDPSDFLIGACQDLNQPPARTSLEKTEPEPFRFDEFLRECCDTSDPDAETSSKDLEGCYRLWRRSTSKVAFLALLDMLRTRFRPVRIKVQPHGVADSVVNGFRGIALRHARDAKEPIPMAASDVEVFIHQMCEYAYAGKALLSDLRAEYGMWRRRVHGSCDDNDVKRMLDFVRSDSRVLPAAISVYEGGCGQGVYGLSISSDGGLLRHRKPSTTAKGVAKIDVATGRELDRWPSIAKAASDEGLAPSRLGRGIRDKSRFDGFVYEFR